ncbi:expressed unknown protein [Seminavis robusta]|uniref:Nudix hydrolase domain-containing protein n=1 Tax=Seminavis robusta TaxID=568900 RepID=A0A9N8HPX6_9STRA|nr:expressed unknown protein [Seminavis robusta]|eukprot:Sro1373_g267260.1 n/a (241) ;mRNA; r:19356-20160
MAMILLQCFLLVFILSSCGVEAIRPLCHGLHGETRSSILFALRCGSDGSSQHEVVKEDVLYSRWRTLTSRIVRFPNGNEVDFDIVGQSGSNRAVLIFAWDTKTKTATLVQEYMPGPHALKAGVAAGMVETKHEEEGVDPILNAAKFELEEECHLVGGTWIRLTDDTNMDKYSTTVVQAFLVLDPDPAVNPKPLDDEEDITIIPNITVPEIYEMIAKGEMNIVGGWTSMVAIQKLRELGEI